MLQVVLAFFFLVANPFLVASSSTHGLKGEALVGVEYYANESGDSHNILRDLDAYDPCDTLFEDVETLEIKFSQANNMDATQTDYVCEQMEVDAPSDESQYHQVKTQVISGNSDALHNVWVYLCEDTESTDGDKVGQGSYSCSGMEENCVLIAGWAVGKEDWCEPPHVGVLLDFGSDKKTVMKIQAHYENGTGQPQSHQTGMNLSLTPTLRPFDASVVVLGMDYWDRQFRIPVGEENYAISNICPSAATEYLSHPIYVYSWNPHMHSHGKSLVTEHYRCGEKIGEIGRIDDYEFDNEQSYYLEKPIKILPGDALVTTCTYETIEEAYTVDDILGGKQRNNELCDNYLTYYPWAGTSTSSNVFTACSAFKEGTNPDLSGYDDRTPFVNLDLTGDVYIYDWEEDPTKAVAPCCATNTCESNYLADVNEACGVDEDCMGDLVCPAGICDNPTSIAMFGKKKNHPKHGPHHGPKHGPHHPGPKHDPHHTGPAGHHKPRHGPRSAGMASQFRFVSGGVLPLIMTLVCVVFSVCTLWL